MFYDYLLVNSTNEFLEEYTDLSENARYKLTGFSGSTGDALLSKSGKIFLFVDGRYHAQADLEVDHSKVEVVKLQVGESFLEKLFDKIEPNSTFAIVSKKNSYYRYKLIEALALNKRIKPILLNSDPILPCVGDAPSDNSVKIDLGKSTLEKIKELTKYLKDDDALFTSNQEEISYLLNKRDFSKNYSSSVKKQKIIITKQGIFDENYKVKGQIFADEKTTNAYDFLRLNARYLPNNPIALMKAVKSAEEIAHYQYCFNCADNAVLATKKFINENDNLSEFDIAQKLEENFKKFGAKSLSFKSIVAKDKNSALAHYSKNSKKEVLKDGSLVLIDCGAYYDGGLATDCTRVFVKGQPSSLQKEVYTKVLKAFLNAISFNVTPLTTGYDLDKIARDILNGIKPQGFEFSHSLGHGIGISVHENPPSLSPSEVGKVPLKPNMCFTIEPGLYNAEHFGIRLENSCYLDENYQIVSFSKLPFEEKLIDSSLLTEKEKEVLSQWM
ncbi:M24 family metallopeptidase [bacterium]|nr:M24 family metallopeptidase [bacterium]